FLLGPCAAGLHPGGQRMAAIEDVGLGMAATNSRALPVEPAPVGGGERLSGVPRSRWRFAASRGRDEGADGEGTGPIGSGDTLPKGSGKPAGALGRTDPVRGRSTDPDGQQRLGTTWAGSGGGPQELLRLGVEVER